MSQGKKILDDAIAELLVMMATLSSRLETTVESATGTMDSFKAEMKKDVKKLEAMMVTGFSNQDLVRKKIDDGFEAKKEAGFRK